MDGINKKRKILYITYDGLTDALGQSQILSYLSPLSRQDNEFYILSFEKVSNYRNNEAIVNQKVKENKLHWMAKWYTKKPPVISTLYDLYRARKEAQKLHKKHRFDIVHCRGYIPALVGLFLKRKYGVRFIFDMRGWWANEKVESGGWANAAFKPVYQYFKHREKEFFSEADFSVSLTEAGKEEIINTFQVPKERVGVVPTCVNFDVFRQRSQPKSEALRLKLGIDPKARVLVYSGALGGNYDLEILLSVFKAFNEAYVNAYILILSKDELTPQFGDQLKEAGISNYSLHNVPYTQVSDFLCLADVGLIFYKPAFSNIGRSPTKLGEYWASGIPVIATDGIGDLNRLEQQYPGGIVLFEKTLHDLKKKMLEVGFDNHELLRQYAEEYCSLERGVSFYGSVYQKLTNSA